MQFRKDINGLRAIAVIAVVLFHFNAAWVPGGFAGVDVFFVISGYLMTGIIFRGLEKKNFSILNFYAARANRIIPALAAVCLVLLLFGWFYLTPIDYKALGKHTASSIGFLSNITYWKEAGYFDVSSHEKWLLHTWSLSVEWQFYIIYPLVLVIMRKYMPLQTIKKIILFSTLAGFIFCIIATYNWPESAYYLLSARAWEMLIGGVAYLYPILLKEGKKRPLEWLGFTLIIGSYFFISKDIPWPGYLAIFPVLGSFLILQAQRNNSLITNNVISQKIGTWSYSIYLWHWPLVVAIHYFSLSDTYVYLCILLSLLLGFLSNKYIEKIKFKKSFENLQSLLKAKPLLMAILIATIGTSTDLSNGFEKHYPDNLIAASNEAKNKNMHCKGENKYPCFIGNKNDIKAIIVGDSHATAISTAFLPLINLEKSGIVVLKKGGCPLIINVRRVGAFSTCYDFNIKRMKYLEANHPNVPVFWISRTSHYLYGLSDPMRINDIRDTQPLIYFTDKYKKAEKKLYSELKENLNLTVKAILVKNPMYILQPTPEMKRNIPKTLAKNILFNIDDDLSLDYDLYLNRNTRIRHLLDEVAQSNKVEILDPIPYLCNNDKCMAQIEGRPIYYDGDHMSEYGNKLLTQMFNSALDNH